MVGGFVMMTVGRTAGFIARSDVSDIKYIGYVVPSILLPSYPMGGGGVLSCLSHFFDIVCWIPLVSPS